VKQCLKRALRLGEFHITGYALNGLGAVETDWRIRIFHRYGPEGMVAQVIGNTGHWYFLKGDFERALGYVEDSLKKL